MTTIPAFGLHEPVASLSHLLAALAAVPGGLRLLLKGRRDPARYSALLVFSAALLFLFAMSGIYHALAPGPWRAAFRRLDYAAIWIVIAASATAVHDLLLDGRWRWGLTAMFWGAAGACLVLIDLYFDRLPYWAVVSAYLALGSLGGVTLLKIAERHGWKEASELFLGGIAYAGGALVDWLSWPSLRPSVFGPHELFHALVITGAALHWKFVHERADRSRPGYSAGTGASSPTP